MKKGVYVILSCFLLALVGCQQPIVEQVISQRQTAEEVFDDTEEMTDDYDNDLWEAQWDPNLYDKPRRFAFVKLPQPKSELIALGREADGYLERLASLFPAYQEAVSHFPNHEDVSIPEELEAIATYELEGDSLGKLTGQLSPEDEAVVRNSYELFVSLVPAEYRSNLSKVEVINHNTFAAAVRRDEDNLSKQVLAINPTQIEILGDVTLDKLSNLQLYVHELAHLFSLHPDETLYGTSTFDPIGSTFDKFKNNSYLNQFHKLFWGGVSRYYKDNVYKPREDFQGFYELNEDNFFTPYAASNPYEDFAESFTAFVIGPAPFPEEVEPKYEKINFFYQYRELVELRAKLLENMVAILGV